MLTASVALTDLDALLFIFFVLDRCGQSRLAVSSSSDAYNRDISVAFTLTLDWTLEVNR